MPQYLQSTCSTKSQLTRCNSRLWVESGWWSKTFVLWYQCSGNSPPLWRKTSRGDAVKGSSVCLWLTPEQKPRFTSDRQIRSKPQWSGMLWICRAYDEEREGWRGIQASRSLTTLLSLRLLTCFCFFLPLWQWGHYKLNWTCWWEGDKWNLLETVNQGMCSSAKSLTFQPYPHDSSYSQLSSRYTATVLYECLKHLPTILLLFLKKN